MNYLHQKHYANTTEPSRFVVSRSPSSCYGRATTLVVQCLEILQLLSKHPNSKKQLVAFGILTELFENNIHQGPKSARSQARAVLCAFSEGGMNAVSQLNNLIQKKVLYCIEHHRSMDIAVATREEMLLLSESTSELVDRNWNGTQKTQDIQLLSYSEWERGASCLDFVRRQCKVSQASRAASHKSRPQRFDFLALKYGLRWTRRACSRSNLSSFELGSWVLGLILSACSQSIRSEMCMLVNLLCAQSSTRRYRLLNLLMAWLPSTLSAAENAVEYFDLLFRMIETEDPRLFLTARGWLSTICKLITQEVNHIESLERSLHIDISQGFILHKLIELLGKFLEIPNTRARFMRDDLFSEVLEALIVIWRKFIHACICGLQIHGDEKKGQTSLFILEQLCNLICPSKPESVYLVILNKAHTQEEFIRGSMTKVLYSSPEVGLLMRDEKNKICNQLDMVGLVENDYRMELLVAGNIISLDLSVEQVYVQVWKKANIQSSITVAAAAMLPAGATASTRDCPPMIVTYRLQRLRDDLKSNDEQLNLLMYCCKIQENRQALLKLGLLVETARR
ncbi:hypothetical protein SOVF_168870 [Spinacia oleracea]|nr:hypothetical protein SOVF_168870 [Spinacia oleracea]